ncbi:MAG: 4Fe-4S binding protein, partial [Candidatus Methanofastidiosa archaeon]|nr:4Fe-4S binding protein [Candidatus Methanofastidiosa archaeon]
MGKKLFILQYVTLASMLGLMVYLMLQKKEPLALLLLLALSAGSLVYGRLFCGYLCPFHAFDVGVTAVRDRTVRWGLP